MTQVREEVEKAVEKAAVNYVEELKKYIKKNYQIDPDIPWKKHPEHLTFREKTSKKWFALLMPVSARKLGMETEDEIVVLNVKAEQEFIYQVSQMEGYQPGYHMNKQHWLTVYLNGTVPLEQVFERVDESYQLVNNTPTKRIYEAVKKIPKGRVATYGQVAELAGDKKMARAVGNALHKNPDPEQIPCYRVVNAKGELAGEFAFGGPGAQAELLERDGIEVVNGKVDLKKYGLGIGIEE